MSALDQCPVAEEVPKVGTAVYETTAQKRVQEVELGEIALMDGAHAKDLLTVCLREYGGTTGVNYNE